MNGTKTLRLKRYTDSTPETWKLRYSETWREGEGIFSYSVDAVCDFFFVSKHMYLSCFVLVFVDCLNTVEEAGLHLYGTWL